MDDSLLTKYQERAGTGCVACKHLNVVGYSLEETDGEDEEERKKERIRMALGQLETALGDIVASGWIGDDKDGTTKERTDTNLDEDFTEKLERARACFRKCTASLGVHGKYKGFAEDEEVAGEDGDNTFARDDAF